MRRLFAGLRVTIVSTGRAPFLPICVPSRAAATHGGGGGGGFLSVLQLSGYVAQLQTACNNFSANVPEDELGDRPAEATTRVSLRLCLTGDGRVFLQAAAREAAATAPLDSGDDWVTVRDIRSDGELPTLSSTLTAHVAGCTGQLSASPNAERDFAQQVWQTLVDHRNASDLLSSTSADAGPTRGGPVGRKDKALTEQNRGPTTVLDFTTSRHEDLLAARQVLERAFPRLCLFVQHTSGTDLQGSRTHTFSVQLRRRVQGSALSAPEQRALALFSGDAVGLGYNGTLRRALQEAFRAAGVSFPERPVDAAALSTGDGMDSSVSVLSLFYRILTENGVRMHVEVTSAAVYLTASKDNEQGVLYSLSGDAKHSLSLLLSAVEAVAEKVDANAAHSVRRSISSSALVVVLPDKGVRVKRILRRLLNYYYGVTEDSVDFQVTSPSVGVFACDVVVPVPFARCPNAPGGVRTVAHEGAQAPRPVHQGAVSTCTLASASSTGKKMAMKLAAVVALRQHFPDVFTEQLVDHPEVRQLLDAVPVSALRVCPHLSKGLKAILEWAVQQENASAQPTNPSHPSEATTAMTTLDLNEAGPSEETGSASPAVTPGVKLSFLTQQLPAGYLLRDSSQRAVANVWETVLTINGARADASHAAFVRPLRVSAVDFKKGRSEQKAFAAALAQRYKHMCSDAVAYAVQNGLVDGTGAPTPCAGLVAALSDSDGGPSGADSRGGPLPSSPLFSITDPILAGLRMTPKQTVALPAQDKPSILALLRERARQVAKSNATNAATETADGESCAVTLREEFTESAATDAEGNGSGVVEARILILGGPGPTPSPADQRSTQTATELSRATHRYRLCALVDAYRKLFSAPTVTASPSHLLTAELLDGNESLGLKARDATEAVPGAQSAEWQQGLVADLFEELPAAIPTSNPVEGVFLALQRLYGAELDVHMYADRKRTTVELWGRVAAANAVSTECYAGAPQEPPNDAAATDKDECYFLAKGSGATAQDALSSCALNAFEAHIRPLKGVFPGRRLRGVSFLLQPTGASSLGVLSAVVAAEITATNSAQASTSECRVECRAELRVHYHAGDDSDRVDLVFAGVMDRKRVELERVRGTSIVAVVHDVCECVAKETSMPFTLRPRTGSQVTLLQQLEHVVRQLLGAEVIVESVLVDRMWYCRVSVAFGGVSGSGGSHAQNTGEYHYCLATASSARKKESVERACGRALHSHLPSSIAREIPGLQSAAVPADDILGTARSYVFTLV